jgi:site-specific DNA-methyltransferase (adenine-specific)
MSNKIQEIWLGDCMELMDRIDENSIQMVLTDLPYGITSNSWDCELPLNELWNNYLRIGKENCVFAFTCCQPFTSKLVCSQIELWKHEWVWIKNRGSNFANTVREPFKEHETVQIFSKGKWIYNKQMQERTGAGLDRVKYKFNLDTKSENYRNFDKKENIKMDNLRCPSSWQKFNTQTGLHPTQKPLELFEYLIKTYTNENDLVLDNCAGSGTTLLAAKRLNRQFIGIEKEKKYYNIILERLKENYIF